MAQQPMGNESNMEQIRKLMEEQKMENLAKEVNEGADAENVMNVDFTSTEGNQYKGKILFKRPSVMEIMKMGGRKSEILRQAGVTELTLVDPSVRMMAQAIATLETVVVKCPEWFLNIHEIQDLDIIFHVYGLYEVWENSFRSSNIKAQTPNSKPAE
jgi:hypothetical protein